MRLEKGLGCFSPAFIQWEEIMFAAAFHSVRVGVSVRQKILQGREKKGPEPALLAVGSRVSFAFDQVREKTLGEVLGIVHGIAAGADEGVKRHPVGLAKLAQSDAGPLGLGLIFRRRDDDAPVRRSERIVTSFRGDWERTHKPTFIGRRGRRQARKKFTFPCSTRLGLPLENGSGKTRTEKKGKL
jgi:hypothetical protein